MSRSRAVLTKARRLIGVAHPLPRLSSPSPPPPPFRHLYCYHDDDGFWPFRRVFLYSVGIIPYDREKRKDVYGNDICTRDDRPGIASLPRLISRQGKRLGIPVSDSCSIYFNLIPEQRREHIRRPEELCSLRFYASAVSDASATFNIAASYTIF